MTTALAVARPHFFEHLFVGGVAVHHRLADLARGAHAHRVEIDGDVFEALRLEHPRHVLAHAAEAAQDDVLALGDRQRGARPRVRSRSSAARVRRAAGAPRACCWRGSPAPAPWPAPPRPAWAARSPDRWPGSAAAASASAMPNSPPTASVTPVRSDLKVESTNRRVAQVATNALTQTIASSSASTSQNSRHNASKSSSMPTEMKNRPSRMSRNGRMTLSTWWLYSVSASIMPARKAPSAMEKPATCEAQAAASATSSTASVNSSRTWQLAMTYSSGRSSQRPAASTSSTEYACRPPPGSERWRR